MYVCMYLCMYVRKNESMYVCMSVFMYVCMHERKHVCTLYVYACVRVRVCMSKLYYSVLTHYLFYTCTCHFTVFSLELYPPPLCLTVDLQKHMY